MKFIVYDNGINISVNHNSSKKMYIYFIFEFWIRVVNGGTLLLRDQQKNSFAIPRSMQCILWNFSSLFYGRNNVVLVVILCL